MGVNTFSFDSRGISRNRDNKAHPGWRQGSSRSVSLIENNQTPDDCSVNGESASSRFDSLHMIEEQPKQTTNRRGGISKKPRPHRRQLSAPNLPARTCGCGPVTYRVPATPVRGLPARFDAIHGSDPHSKSPASHGDAG